MGRACVNLSYSPVELIVHVFDSIHVIVQGEEMIKIKFSPTEVVGYTENIYNNFSVWEEDLWENPMPTMYSTTYMLYYEYIFSIS
ncbi:MAG: hypothetical protein PF541_15445 [Prolixibacteraceae bacterium]|nr:hypothetical protein [Prolixibacteraceae bacterium]